jgi:hypothetical protein
MNGEKWMKSVDMDGERSMERGRWMKRVYMDEERSISRNGWREVIDGEKRM